METDPPGTAPPFLPYGQQSIDEADIAAVAAALRSPLLTQGPAVEAFEHALAARLGAGAAVVCANGTAALHLAALGLGLGPGDAVVVPAVTFLATANAMRFTGAEVAFADVDPDTGLLTPEHAEAAIARAEAAGWTVRAVIPVQLAGQTVAPEPLAALAAAHGLAVVEDACHALGSTVRAADGTAVPVGACRWSTMATFSFHPVKIIATGEGGAVATNDPVLAARLRRLRSHGMVRESEAFEDAKLAFDGGADGAANPWYYEMPELGFNYRLSDLQCALGLSQLDRLDAFVAARRALAGRYDRLLAPLAPLLRPLGRVPGGDPAWHLYVVLIDFAALGRSRAALMTALRQRGIGTQVHYIPVHRQPYYRRRYGALALPGAESYYRRALSLPLFPGMTTADVYRVAATLSELIGPALR